MKIASSFALLLCGSFPVMALAKSLVIDKRPTEAKTPMGIDEGTGILLKDTMDIVISGNNFSGLSTPAVRTEGGCARLNVSGNIASDPRRGAIGARAFDLGTAAKSILRDNIDP